MYKNKIIKIGSRYIGDGKPCFLIAEAGVNHNGDIKLAKRLIDAAKESGADAVKFQTFKTEELVTITAPQAKYQKKYAFAMSQYEMLKKLELKEKDFKKLFNYCKKKGILFLSTPSDTKSAEFLFKLGVPAFKVSSGDLTNLPFIKQIASYKLPVILSTGMAFINEVEEAVNTIYKMGNKKLILMHCTSEYPAIYKDINLEAIKTLAYHFKIPIGLSDHSPGVDIAIAARALGACVIEKHFTISKKLKGPDHKSSSEPRKFLSLVKSIRTIEEALGDGIKRPSKLEMDNRKIVWRSLVASRDLYTGHKMTRDDISIKRPGTGILPKYINNLVGKTLKKPLKKDQLFKWAHFQK